MDISASFLNMIKDATGNNIVLSIIISLALVLLGFFFLIKGADMFVDGASKVAQKLKIPLIVIGLTIVAFGTSAPEAAISITSACKNEAGIAIGNVVGSNIMNILIILGVSALFCALPVKKTTFRYEIPFTVVITAVLLLLGLDGSVSFWDAIILLVFFAAFFAYLIVLSKKGSSDSTDDIEPLSEKDTVLRMIIFIILGLAAIVLGSDFTVTGATEIAQIIGVDSRIIGLTIVAFGTSLPELVTSVTAAKKGCTDIAIGNIIGSNIFNILFVIGLSGVVSPSPIAYRSDFIIDTIIAIAAAVMLWLLVVKTKKLGKGGGIAMIVCYAVYFVYLLLQPVIFGSLSA